VVLAARGISAGNGHAALPLLAPAMDELNAARPTAVNLAWALARMRRALAAAGAARMQADAHNPLHLGAPMPGAVVTVAVAAGQQVQSGAPLLSLEAMKMETQILADRDGTVEQVLVQSGQRVQAKDLLLVWRG